MNTPDATAVVRKRLAEAIASARNAERDKGVHSTEYQYWRGRQTMAEDILRDLEAAG